MFLGGQFVGGASELESIIEAGRLEDVLEERRGSPALPEDLARAVERSRAQVTALAATLNALLSMAFTCVTWSLRHRRVWFNNTFWHSIHATPWLGCQQAGVAPQTAGVASAEEYASLQAVAKRLRARLFKSQAHATERQARSRTPRRKPLTGHFRCTVHMRAM